LVYTQPGQAGIEYGSAEDGKICGIALRGAGATTSASRRLRSVFSIKIDSISKFSIVVANTDLSVAFEFTTHQEF